MNDFNRKIVQRAGVFLGGFSCLAASAVSASAQVQTQAAPGLEQVIVTATRREERLQDVPVAVSALTTQMLEQKQVIDLQTLAKVVPGMGLKPGQNEMGAVLSIRGVTQLNQSPTIDPPIGVYVDGVYNVLNAGTNTGYIDMARVEVLKGPQGTLFGRNTIGGAVNITTQAPTDKFEGYAMGSGGNYGAWTALGVVNVPVVPGALDVRLVYQHREREGYGRSILINQPTGAFDQDYMRGSIKITASDRWDVLVTGAYTRIKGTDTANRIAYNASPLNAAYPAASGAPGDLLSNYLAPANFQDNYGGNLGGTFSLRQYTATGTVTGALSDALTVKSITGYIHTDARQTLDFDDTPYPLYETLRNDPGGYQFSEELQAFGDALDNRLNWFAGAYVFTFEGQLVNLTRQAPNLSPPAARFDLRAGPVASNQSYSAFAQATYKLTPDVRLTAGVRYVIDKRQAGYIDQRRSIATGAFMACTLANAADPVTGALGASQAGCNYANASEFKYAPWTVGLDYKPNDDSLLYVKLSQGYRAGAYPINTGPVATAPSATITAAQALTADSLALRAFGAVPPEKLLQPEIGAKLQFLDGRLTVNAAAFYSWYDNIQLTTVVSLCAGCTTTSVIVNSGNAHVKGGEIEVAALLGKLKLGGNLGYADPEYQPGALNYGFPVVNVSKVTASASASYPVDTAIGLLTLNGAYAYRSKALLFSYPAGTPAAQIAAITQPGFGLWDARVSLDLDKVPVTLAIYGQNLADKKYVVSGSSFPSPFAFVNQIVGPPRTFGGSVKVSF